MAERTAIFQEHLISPKTARGAIWPFNPSCWRPAHYHAQVEFLLVLRGRLRERVGRALHTAHAGHLIWHLPGVEHEVVEASSDCDFVVLQAEPDLCAAVGQSFRGTAENERDARPAPFSSWIRQLGWLAAGRPVVELKQADRDRVLEACAITCASEQLLPDQAALRLHAALAGAWRATWNDHDDRRPNSLVELACCLILEDPSLDRSAVCRTLDVSESYLSRLFQRELGISFVEQRARLRLARFCTHVSRERYNYLNDPNCTTDYASTLIREADLHQAGWTAWAWYPGGCTYPALIEDWAATPSALGATVKAALLGYGGPHPEVEPEVAMPIDYTFDSGAEGWRLNDYQDPDLTNLGGETVAGVAPPTLTFNSSEGDPEPGSLELHVTLSASDQYVIAQAQVTSDLTDKTLHARVRLKSGTLNGARLTLHACPDNFACSEGPAADPDVLGTGEWQSLEWDLSTVTEPAFHAAKIVTVGIAIDATMSADGAPDKATFPSSSEAVLLIDTFTE